MSGRMILLIGSTREASEYARDHGLRLRDVRAVTRPSDLNGYHPSQGIEVRIGRTAAHETVNEAYRRGMIE